MRFTLFILIAAAFSAEAKAGDAQWFVAVYGESMQLISGASATADVTDGVYLSTDFAGTEIYVRVQKGYELDGFRPYESASSSDMVSSITESADAAAPATEPEEQSKDEFGPLTDTSVQYYVNFDYFGWDCSEMYVQPMGERVYRLRCGKEMKHSN